MTLGEQAVGRWITLRNTFTKKLRERKAGQPSGSEWKMAKMWVYFKQMSFLTPHIAHRMQVYSYLWRISYRYDKISTFYLYRSRSSMPASQQEKSI